MGTRYWQHRVNWEGGLDILLSEKRLTIGFSDIAADDAATEALCAANWDSYCNRYAVIYKGKIPRNKATLWRFVVEMKVGDVVVVPFPWGFHIYRIKSAAIKFPSDGRDLGWFREVEPIAADCSPRHSYASESLLSAMRCQKTNIEITRLADDVDASIDMRRRETGGVLERQRAVPYRKGVPYEIAHEMMDGVLQIPPVQRGFVWKATQVEVLWDSILRQIPLGTFSVRPHNDIEGGRVVWDLIDGQQRSTAIEIAYHQFPPSAEDYQCEVKLSESEKREKAFSAPILWIDLWQEPQEKYARKYFFRVTTDAQPWGYKLSENETSNMLLEVSRRRAFVERLSWHAKENAVPLEDMRPYPSELWPMDAKKPVPFELLERFVRETVVCRDDSSHADPVIPSFSSFINYCYGQKDSWNGDSRVHCWNWLEWHFPLNDVIEDPKGWQEFVQDLLNVNEYVIFQQNARLVAQDDLGVYFKRIGRGGSVPPVEEIAYSMLKVRLPEQFKKVMDEVASRGITSSAHMADLAIRLWASRRKKSAVWGVSNQILMEICENENSRNEFNEFIVGGEGDEGSFRWFLARVDMMLGIGLQNGSRLLKWHRAQFCTKDSDRIYQYLLMHADNPEEDIDYAGLASFLLYHSEHLDRVVRTLNDYSSVREGLIHAYRNNYYSKPDLDFPVFPEQLNVFQNAFNYSDWCNALKQAFASCEDWTVQHLVTAGYKNQYQYAILLQATKTFVEKIFPGYDSASHLWSEENCPWDYDHIMPKSWMEEGAHLAKWDQVNSGGVISLLINSIANLAPLPFSINRSKSDAPPTASYPFSYDYQDKKWIEEYQRDLLLRTEKGCVLDGFNFAQFNASPTKNAARVFCKGLIERLIQIYSSWFYGLGMETLLDFSKIPNQRKDLLSNSKLRGVQGWHVVANGLEVRFDETVRDNFYWHVRSRICLTKRVAEGSLQGAEIVYSDDGIGECVAGVRAENELTIDDNMVQRLMKLCPSFNRSEDKGPWILWKRYERRPAPDVLDADLQNLDSQIYGLK